MLVIECGWCELWVCFAQTHTNTHNTTYGHMNTSIAVCWFLRWLSLSFPSRVHGGFVVCGFGMAAGAGVWCEFPSHSICPPYMSREL